MLLPDLRLAFRGFRRSPALYGAVVAILALGIGMALAVATVTETILIARLPVADQERLVVLWPYRDGAVEMPVLRADIDRLRHQSTRLRAVAGVSQWGGNSNPYRDGERSLALTVSVVTGSYFDVLSTRPTLGRLIRPEDDVSGTTPVAVLSYGAWLRHFGASPDVIGRRLVDPYTQTGRTIVGVAAPGLDFPLGTDLWVPIPDWSPPMNVVARLAPGATRAAAADELLELVRPANPEWHLVGATATPLVDLVLGRVRPVLWAVTAAVGLLLLITCVNVGTLMLLRASHRTRELAVRRALGASTGAIVRHLLAETLVLVAAGGAIGGLLAIGLLRLLVIAWPMHLPRVDAIPRDRISLGLWLAATAIAALACALGPALAALRGTLGTSIRVGSRGGSETRVGRRWRETLTAAQVALALVLLTGATLVVTTLSRLQNQDLGYQPEHLSILSISGSIARYGSADRLRQLGDALVGPLRRTPGVVAITPVLEAPYNGVSVWRWRFDAEGQSAADADRNPLVPIEVGGSEFLRTLGVSLKRGRGFLDTDRAGAELVVIVSEGVARRFWPGQDPIGKRVRIPGTDPSVPGGTVPGDSAWRTVIGVVGDLHLRALREGTPSVYLPWQQGYWQGYFAVRTTGPIAPLLPSFRAAVSRIDADLLLWDAATMDQLLAAPLAQPRLTAVLLAGFGLTALILSGLGLYGVMATIVRERTRQIGIRMALGASAERVRREVLGRALGIFGVGATVGLIASLSTTHLLRGLLFEVRPTEPIAFVAAGGLLLAVILGAAYGPARRATRVDPVSALRADE